MADEQREEVLGLVGLGRPNHKQELPPEQHKMDPRDGAPAAGRRGVRTRQEALQERQRIHDARRKADAAAAGKVNLEAGFAVMARMPCVFVLSNGIYLNSAEVRKLCAEGSPVPESLPLDVRVLGAYGEFRGWDCYRAEDVVDMLNSGRAGTANMGRLELVFIESVADLDGEPGRLLGYLTATARAAGMTTVSGDVGIEDHFAIQKGQLVLSAVAPPSEDPPDPEKLAAWADALPEECFSTHALAAWLAIDGRPHKGPVGSIREAVPFQVLLAWSSTSTEAPRQIVAVRSLKYGELPSDQVAMNAAPFEVAFDPATGELLHASDLPCAESWRPRLADLGPLVVAVDVVAKRVLYVRPYAPDPVPEAPPLADSAGQFLAEHADDPALKDGEEQAGG